MMDSRVFSHFTGFDTAGKISEVRTAILVQGCILEALYDACGGEGIFYRRNLINNILLHPTTALLGGINLTRLGNSILHSLDDGTPPMPLLRLSLLRINFLLPKISRSAEKLATLVQRFVLEIAQSKILTDDAYTLLSFDSTSTVSLSLPRVRVSTRTTSAGTKLLGMEPTTESLFPLAQTPRFEILGIILRETLLKRRNAPQWDFALRRILDNQNPDTGARLSSDPDQVNPARLFMDGVVLLRVYVPASHITTYFGLASFLAYMGTGQGNLTRRFLEFSPHNTFPFSNLDDCLQAIEAAELHNTSVQPQDQIQIANSTIWGQSANSLGLRPTIIGSGGQKVDLLERFEPYFTSKVGDAWANFLGSFSLAGALPSSIPVQDKPEWWAMHNFIASLNIPGFQTGLTLFQACNNLSILEVCRPPTPEEMAHWVSLHRGLGAFNGLRLTGFCLGEGTRQTRAAFMCVYNYLDEHLSPGDKATLGFGAIFVEHLLCKVSRWTKRCSEMVKSQNLSPLKDLLEYARGKYDEDVSGFPIPSCQSLCEFTGVLEREKVRHNNPSPWITLIELSRRFLRAPLSQ